MTYSCQSKLTGSIQNAHLQAKILTYKLPKVCMRVGYPHLSSGLEAIVPAALALCT